MRPDHVTLVSASDRTEVQAALVRKQIIDEPTAIDQTGLRVLDREDPVLRYLAQSDEREYSKMFDTDTAISAATEQRVRGLLAAGSGVMVGRKGRAAEMLKDFAIQFLKRVPRLNAVRANMQDATYWGWRPVELKWTTGGQVPGRKDLVLPEFRFNGNLKAYVYEAKARKSWNFRITTDRALVWTPGGGTQSVVFDSPVDRLRWLTCTAGDTASPYGCGWYKRLWLPYFIKRNYGKMSADAMRRSLGLIRMKWKGSGSMGGAQPTDDPGLDRELNNLIARATSSGILVETANWTFDFLDSIDFSGTHREMLEQMNTELRLAIVGQNLTSEISRQGSRAAAQVHENVLETFQKADALEEAAWINDMLLRPAIELNFPDPDPADMPRFASKLTSRPDKDALRLFFDMGGRIDGERVADSFNLPIADDDTPVVLERRGGPALGTGEELEPGTPGRPAEQTLTTPTPLQELDTSLDETTEAALGAAAEELETYYETFGRELLAANPDP